VDTAAGTVAAKVKESVGQRSASAEVPTGAPGSVNGTHPQS